MLCVAGSTAEPSGASCLCMSGGAVLAAINWIRELVPSLSDAHDGLAAAEIRSNAKTRFVLCVVLQANLVG